MSFIQGIIADILQWLLSKAGGAIVQSIEAYQADEAAKAQASRDAKGIANATTPQSQEQATTSAAHDTFS